MDIIKCSFWQNALFSNCIDLLPAILSFSLSIDLLYGRYELR